MAVSEIEKRWNCGPTAATTAVLHRAITDVSLLARSKVGAASHTQEYQKEEPQQQGSGSGDEDNCTRQKQYDVKETPPQQQYAVDVDEDDCNAVKRAELEKLPRQHWRPDFLLKSECECCGHSEECSTAYIERVKRTYCGHFVCGLCAEAIQEEFSSRHAAAGSPMEAAVQSHLDMCGQFTQAAKTSPPPRVTVAGALCHVLRRHLSVPSTPTTISGRNLGRSTSCLASFRGKKKNYEKNGEGGVEVPSGAIATAG